MNPPTKIVVAALLMSSFSSAYALDTLTLTVEGSLTPNACIPQLSPKTVSFGKVLVSSLSSDSATTLPTKPKFLLSISCQQAMPAHVMIVDEQAASLVGSSDAGSYHLSQKLTGLGTGSSPVNLLTAGVDKNWGKAGLTVKSGSYQALAASSGQNDKAPGAHKLHQMEFEAEAVIQPSKNLALTKEVDLQGSIRFEITYM